MTTTYRLKISLAEPFLPITQLHRIVDVDETTLLHDLARQIGTVFDVGVHDWQFFISRIKNDNLGKLQASPTINTANNLPLHEVSLQEKEYCYLQVGGWLYRIRIEKISQSIMSEPFVLIRSVGELPKPPATDESLAQTDFSRASTADPALDLELSILSAMMLVVGNPSNPIRYDNLMKTGIADEMIKRNLIKPYVNPAHRVKLTPFGESELVRMMELLGI